MSEKRTELQRMEVLRLSNLESNRITKECLESALIFLMKEKAFNEISITDIVKKAGVSRTAYYRNYSSKEDILNHLLEDVVDTTFHAMNAYDPDQETYHYWYSMFKNVRPHAETYQLLLKANFGETLLFQITQKVKESIPADYAAEKYEAIFWSGAAYAILTEWIQSGMKQSEKEMAKLCCAITGGTVDSSKSSS
ncbi:TetR/AcrR family transcriptional regulator [Paenibacillus sp. Z6-24]